MHIWTRLKKESEGKTGLGIYPDGMVEHDAMVGQVLDKLKELGLDDNTIVMYSTDNGAEKFTWPDGGTSPFRGEKNTNWEGGYRVPAAIRWPGVIKPGTVLNDIVRARRHAADAAGRRGRARRQGAAPEGHEGRRQDLQGPSRRLQPHRRSPERPRAPPGVLLLQRRRLAGGEAQRDLQIQQVFEDLRSRLETQLVPKTWPELLEILALQERRWALCLDEFPYLTAVDPSLPSQLQKWLDHSLPPGCPHRRSY